MSGAPLKDAGTSCTSPYPLASPNSLSVVIAAKSGNCLTSSLAAVAPRDCKGLADAGDAAALTASCFCCRILFATIAPVIGLIRSAKRFGISNDDLYSGLGAAHLLLGSVLSAISTTLPGPFLAFEGCAVEYPIWPSILL